MNNRIGGFDLADKSVPTLPLKIRWWSSRNNADHAIQISRGLRNKARAIALLDSLHIEARDVMETEFVALQFREVDGKTVAGLSYAERFDPAKEARGEYSQADMEAIGKLAAERGSDYPYIVPRFHPYTDQQLEQWFPEGWQR